MKHVVCYSGGHSSAVVAIEVARRFGAQNTVLLNHDIPATVEAEDIKRFKRDVAAYLGLPITYASHRDSAADQFDVCVAARAFKVNNGSALCTARLKTEPFQAWLSENAPPAQTLVYYGFDANEPARIQRRSGFMAAMNYGTDFPLATWAKRTIQSTEEIGIRRPNVYDVFKHGNCIGCLKAGWQHWFIVFCTRPDVWAKGKWAEEEIGYAIHHDESGPVYLEDMEPKFIAMRAAGVAATEKVPHQRFWADARRVIPITPDAPAAVACDECSLA